jgi:hypothetical protein
MKLARIAWKTARLVTLGIAMLGLFACDDRMDEIDSAVAEHPSAESDRIRDAYRAGKVSFEEARWRIHGPSCSFWMPQERERMLNRYGP